jgi:hypothetical protein
VSDLDRSMHMSLWVWVAHSSFIEGSHTTKNTANVKRFYETVPRLAFSDFEPSSTLSRGSAAFGYLPLTSGDSTIILFTLVN